MELITIEKNEFIDLLRESQKPLLSKITQLEAKIESLMPADKKLNRVKASEYIQISEKILAGISYIEGEENPTKKKRYKAFRIGKQVFYDLEVLQKIKKDFANENLIENT